jgi:hypothetical protein
MNRLDRRTCASSPLLAVAVLLALSLAIPPALSSAQQVVRLPVPYHSQIPPGDPNIGPGFIWTEPGNAVIPNGFCTVACIDMLMNYWSNGGVVHGNPPLPQQEIAAVANTNDPMGLDGHAGTFNDDARRAVHFSPTSPAWPSPPPAYVNANRTGYTWPGAFAVPGPRTQYGLVGIEGVWGWSVAQFKQVLALGYPIIVHLNAAALGDNPPENDLGDSDAIPGDTDYTSVEDTVVGHSVVVRGYNNNWGTILYRDPTLGIAKMSRQTAFWDTLWTSKEFLIVAPWHTSIDVPPLGSYCPNGFQVSATATYTDPLPVQGTGVPVNISGLLGFYAISSDSLNSALAQGQNQTIPFVQNAASGQIAQNSWNCVAIGYGAGTEAIAETWGRVNASATSFPNYIDDIGSWSPRTQVWVPRPTVTSDPSICHIPRGRWWDGAHVSVLPHDYAPGVPNDFVVEIENRGDFPATDVYVDFYFGDPGLAQFSGDPEMMPFATTVVPFIGPGETVLTDPVIFAAPGLNSFGQEYYNFLVECHSPLDPPHDLWVELDNNIACKAVHHAQIPLFTGTYLQFWMTNPFPEPCTVVMRLETSLPDGWNSQLVPAGMDSVVLGPDERLPRMLTMDAMSEGIGMATVREDVYDLDGHFLGRAGGLTFLVWTDGTGVPDEAEITRAALLAPSPNPTSGPSMIVFALPRAGAAELCIYNVAGQRVAELHRGPAAAGYTSVAWDGRDTSGSRIASGVYLARLDAGGEVRTQKILVIR